MSKSEFLSKLTREQKVSLLFNNKIFKEGVIANYPLENNNHVDYYLSDEQLELLKGLETNFDLNIISEFAERSSLDSVDNIVYIPFGNYNDKKGFDSLFTDFNVTIKFINSYIECLQQDNFLVGGVFYLTTDELSEKFSEMSYLLKNRIFDLIIINDNDNLDLKLLLNHGLDTLVFLNDGNKTRLFNLIKEKFRDEESLINHLELKDSSSKIDDELLEQILVDLEEFRLRIESVENMDNLDYSLNELEEVADDVDDFKLLDDGSLSLSNKGYQKKKLTTNNRKGFRIFIKVLLNILAVVLAFGFYVGLGHFMEYNESIQAFMIFITILLLYFLLRVLNNLYKVNFGISKIVSKNEMLLSELETVKPVFVYSYNEEKEEEVFEEKIVEESILTFESLIDLSKYVNKLNDYFKVNGITASTRLVRNMFANLVANRINVLTSNNEELLVIAYQLFAKFVGANINVLDVNNNMTDLDYLENDRSPLNQAIKIANQSKEKINILILKYLNYDKFASNYRNIIEHAKSPNTKHSFKVRGKEFRIPRNLWFIVLPNEQIEPRFYGDLRNAATFSNMYLEPSEVSTEIVESDDKLSFYMLNDIMRDERGFYYLEEDDWKKLDKLDEYLAKLKINIFNNYVIQAVESFTTMYLLTDGDKTEVLDDLLAVKIFPQVTGLDVSKIDDSDLSFVDFCEDLFGVENLNNSQAILNKIQELSNQK